MSDLNTMQLSGRLTKDPEMISIDDKTCLNINLANEGTPRSNGEKRVSFFKVALWGKLAETMSKLLHKGTFIVLSGTINQSRWTDVETQKSRSEIELTANRIYLPSGTGKRQPEGNESKDEWYNPEDSQ